LEGVCFTGRISRLVNCLSGFDDIINIGISDSEQLGIIISVVKNHLLDTGTYTLELHRSIAQE
jgi:hypothetical protein